MRLWSKRKVHYTVLLYVSLEYIHAFDPVFLGSCTNLHEQLEVDIDALSIVDIANGVHVREIRDVG